MSHEPKSRGGAYSDRKILNPEGKSIRLPRWAATRLWRLGFCRWDKHGRKWHIDSKIHGFMDLLKTPDFKPKGLRALKLQGKEGGRPKRCGYSSELLRVLGPELDGIGHPSSAEIGGLKGDLERNRRPIVAEEETGNDAQYRSSEGSDKIHGLVPRAPSR